MKCKQNYEMAANNTQKPLKIIALSDSQAESFWFFSWFFCCCCFLLFFLPAPNKKYQQENNLDCCFTYLLSWQFISHLNSQM